VPVQTKGHDEIREGQYPYTGAYKRYRVARDRSKPGIVVEIRDGAVPGGKTVKIQPVVEYFYASPDLKGWDRATPGGFCLARTRPGEGPHRHKLYVVPGSLRAADGPPQNGERKLLYHGPYRFGMDLTLKSGELGKGYHHRFYEKTGAPILAELSEVHFYKKPEDLKQKVYAGKFKRWQKANDPRCKLDNDPWFQDLSTLKPGDWVYFQKLGQKTVGLGKNFLFKTLFLHADAVPAENRACRDPENLCPRCRLFGMSAAEGEAARGLKSRFKASALWSRLEIREEKIRDSIPRKGKSGLEQVPVDVVRWVAGDQVVGRQVLLPIEGAPKPNRRDTGGYYEKESGEIRGAKYYPHAAKKVQTLEELEAFIKQPDRRRTNYDEDRMPYTHELRSYAVVCREGIEFTGTLGAENCSPAEASALLLLLERGLSDFGFKIGLGKAFGLGSIASRIDAVWVRTPGLYERWVRIGGGGRRLEPEALLGELDALLPGLAKEVESRRRLAGGLNRLDGMIGREPRFPKPGAFYWKDFNASPA
jgi:hypothetical protein